jgi:hypothetical protein
LRSRRKKVNIKKSFQEKNESYSKGEIEPGYFFDSFQTTF